MNLLLLFSCKVVCDCLQPHELQHTRLPCTSLSPLVCSNSYLLSQWCHPTISFSVTPFSSCPQSLPVSGSFPMSWLFASGCQSIGACFSVSPSNAHSGLVSFLDWLVWSPCPPRDSQESTIAPQFESIYSLVLSLPYGPTLTSIHDYWKKQSICTFVGKVISLLLIHSCHSFSSNELVSFNFMTVVNFCSDFGDHENEICHCFCFFPMYLPWSDGTGWHVLSYLNVEF